MFSRIIKYLITILLIADLAYAVPISSTGFELGDNRESSSTSGTFSVQGTTVVSGSYALKVYPTGAAVGYQEIITVSASGTTSNPNFSPCYTDIDFRYATKAASNDEEILAIRNTGNTADKLTVRLNSSGNLCLYDKTPTLIGCGSTVIASNTTTHLGVKASNGTSGSYELQINGATELSGTADMEASNCGAVRIGKVTNRNSNSVEYYYDNFVYSDDGFHRYAQILVAKPTSDGSTAQFTSGTNASNYLEVDEIPSDDDTTYIKNPASVSRLHLVNVQDTGTIGVSGNILSVKAWQRIKEDTAVTSSSHLRVNSGASNSDTSARDLSTSYASYGKMQNTDPATGSAWTTSAVDSMQIGHLEDNAVQVRNTQILAFIVFESTSTTTTSTTIATTTTTSTTTTTTTIPAIIAIGDY